MADNAIVSLLNKVLDNKYSASKNIQVQELITWNLWPDIIKIFGEGFKYIILCTYICVTLLNCSFNKATNCVHLYNYVVLVGFYLKPGLK